MALDATLGRRCLTVVWAAALFFWAGEPVCRAAGVSLHDRGPCPDVVDGVCIPNRRNFGWYAPKWRQWPGDVPAPVAVEEREKSVIQRDVRQDVPPFELPPPEQEADPPELQGTSPAEPAEQPEGPPPPGAVPGETPDTGDAPPALPPALQDDGGLPPGTPVDPDLLMPVEPDPFPTEPPATDGAALPPRDRIRVRTGAWPGPARTDPAPATLTASAVDAEPSPQEDANPLRRSAEGHPRQGPTAPRAFVAASPPRRLSSWTPSRRHNPLRSE